MRTNYLLFGNLWIPGISSTFLPESCLCELQQQGSSVLLVVEREPYISGQISQISPPVIQIFYSGKLILLSGFSKLPNIQVVAYPRLTDWTRNKLPVTSVRHHANQECYLNSFTVITFITKASPGGRNRWPHIKHKLILVYWNPVMYQFMGNS